MRILHVHTRYRQPGGEDTVVEAERRLLADAGYEVVPYDLHNPDEAIGAAVRLMAAPWNPVAAGKVVEAALGEAVDLVHVHNTWFSLSPVVVSHLAKADVPVVATFHNYRLVCVNAMLFRDGSPCELCVGRSPLPGVRYRCYRESAIQSAAVAVTIGLHRRAGTWSQLSAGIALTEFARQRLIEGGVPPDRLHVKPNFVEDPGPRIQPPSASDEVLYVGRLSPEKGVALLLEAWRRAQPEGLRLVVVGDGPEAERLAAMDVSRVELVGRLGAADVRQRMLAARALVVPSIWFEGMPMVLLEAMAAGLPLLISDLGALAEIAGEGGFVHRGGDPDALASDLRSIVEGASVDQRGAAARSRYVSRYEPVANAAQLNGIYRAAVAARGTT